MTPVHDDNLEKLQSPPGSHSDASGVPSDLLTRASQGLMIRCFKSHAAARGALSVSVGINCDQFCQFLSDRGFAIENQSDGISGDHNPLWGTAIIPIETEIRLDELLVAVDSFCRSYLIGFDLDGTLVDTSESFDTTVAELVLRHSGRDMPEEELKSLRAEGGFNNNWDAAVELIRRRGKTLTRKELDPEALEIYFSLAEKKEKLIVDYSTLEILAKRHPLFILTGRCQFEYQPVWATRLHDRFEKVYCLDDLPHCKPKPAGDSLTEILKAHNATSGVYIGNALDDVWAARAANMHSIAVTTTHTAEELSAAGAQLTYASPNGVLEAFKL